MSNGKPIVNLSTAWLTKMGRVIWKTSCFPELHANKKKVESESELSNYATEDATGVDTS